MNPAEQCPFPALSRLLVATERSEFSEGAVREAVSLAKRCSSVLYVMTVVETNPEYETIGAEFLQKEEEEAVQHLKSIKARASGEKVRCEVFLRSGTSPSQLIVEEATQRQCDMIIIGRRGRRGLERVLLGSAASKVIGHAHCRVLVVPKAARLPFRNMLVATDGSEHAEKAAAAAVEIAGRTGGSLLVVSVISPGNEKEIAEANVAAVASAAQKAGVAVEAITPTGRPSDVIAETAGGRGVDLIVIGTFGSSGLKKFLMGSTTEKAIGMAGCATLIVK
ncbi:MAG: universal stress protein [Nitrospiraceae bacterium]|nr:universal stress protein [Nitrospiraceae bacterium]